MGNFGLEMGIFSGLEIENFGVRNEDYFGLEMGNFWG